jgi:hypothetical protein
MAEMPYMFVGATRALRALLRYRPLSAADRVKTGLAVGVALTAAAQLAILDELVQVCPQR